MSRLTTGLLQLLIPVNEVVEVPGRELRLVGKFKSGHTRVLHQTLEGGTEGLSAEPSTAGHCCIPT